MTDEARIDMSQLLRGIHYLGLKEKDNAWWVVFDRVEKGATMSDDLGPFAARATAEQKVNEVFLAFLRSRVEEEARKGSAK